MNNVKKLLSVVLVLTMLMSVCSLLGYAAFDDAVPAGNALSVRVYSDKTNYAPGEDIVFDVNFKAAAGSPNWGGGTLGYGFDTDVLEYRSGAVKNGVIDNLISVEGTAHATHFNLGSCRNAVSADIPMNATEIGTYGWDEVIRVDMQNNEAGAGVDFTTEATSYKWQLKIKDDAAPGTYYFGLVKEGLDNSEVGCVAAVVCQDAGSEIYNNIEMAYLVGCEEGNIYDQTLAVCSFTVGASGPSVANGLTKAQWADKDAGTMNLGFLGTISGATLVTEGTEITSGLYKVGVVYSATDSTPTIAEGALNSECYTLYTSGTDYVFRSVMYGVPYTGADNIYATVYIITAEGEEPIYADSVITTTGAAEYAAAVGRDATGTFAK